MRQRNIDIRDKAKQADVKLWEIGEKLGMSESTFSRFLRKETDENTKNRILSIIEELQKDDQLLAICV
jgi:AraC-like DNA-binding protein